jgi:mono/diheme cytochrome c family protein
MTLKWIGVSLILCMPVVALAQTAGDPETGRRTALTLCVNCHLVSNEQRTPPLDGVPPFDELARDRALTESRLRGFLNHPHPAMPDPQLSRQELDNIVSFILARRAALPN